jgi:hypothetical protein
VEKSSAEYSVRVGYIIWYASNEAAAIPVKGFVVSTSWVMPTVNTVFSAVPLDDGVSSALAGTSGSARATAIAPTSAAHAFLRLPVLIRDLRAGL